MKQGQFFWYDLVTTDTKAAAAFYGAVVGWGSMDASTASQPYSLFTANGVPVAGLMPLPAEAKGMPPVWLGYIWADDVDAMCKRLEQEGGKATARPWTFRESFALPWCPTRRARASCWPRD